MLEGSLEGLVIHTRALPDEPKVEWLVLRELNQSGLLRFGPGVEPAAEQIQSVATDISQPQTPAGL